ncbi:probable G-protein coupled receptor 142 [Physella acuta]|uniref:probable G-protein coupled receptor 142 n=1 Tax=Physella acuta TaxID=109671 RepID=UPI0027DBC5F8|nr:probable G-protein coupled receptor 142 [Physella acuta]
MRKCNTSAAYLATLAVSDFLFLILTVGNELQYPWMVGALDLQGWCQIWNVLSMTSQYISLMLVFAFTVERFISVCRPFSCEKFSKNSRSSKIITAILFISFLLALPQAVFWNVSPEIGECSVRTVNSTTINMMYVYWNWTSELVMFGVVPIVAFILNACVLKQIRTVGKLYVTSETLHRHVGARCTSTTATLMWISFYLIFSKLPVTIVFTMEPIIQFGEAMPIDAMSRDPVWQRYISYFTARKIIIELGISHHACNIFIYAATSKQFRNHLKFILLQIFWCKAIAPKSSPSQPARPRYPWIHSKA